MEINDENLKSLASYLQQTLQPDVNIRKPAEKFLENNEKIKGYSLLLLYLIDREDVDLTIRVAGAITFKNFVKRNWKIDEDGVNNITDEDRQKVKGLIVTLMLKSPEAVQKQLSDAISVIGKEDFPLKWPELIQLMVDKFSSGDFRVINGILQTAHSLFKRYRFEFKSEKLWTEIKFVIDNFAKPFTELFAGLMGLAKEHENNKDALKIIFNSILMVSKIFNSLNIQEIPEYFEDNMNIWMPHFLSLLKNENPLLKTSDDEEAGLLEQLKSQICENVGMYAQKYEEEFSMYLPEFVNAVWTLLVTTGNQSKYDLLVSSAIHFLALVAEKAKYTELFNDHAKMSSICEKVIIPNMEFRESDEELFEDNPEEYIRRDIEGSDVDTRRRAACDFVRALSRFFESQITEIFGQYVKVLLNRYTENPKMYWKDKDTAIYLITSITSRGQTQKHGVTITNQLVDTFDFYRSYILTELIASDVNDLPVLKADALKYVMIFRNQLPQSEMKQISEYLVKFLRAQSPVIHTYAACTLEKALLLKQTDNTALIKSHDLKPVATDLLVNLFNILDTPASKENEYVMKAIMRSFSALQEGIVPYMGQLLPKLTNKLLEVARNPSKPDFNHYLFESLSLSVRIMCKENMQFVPQFEATLFPIFQKMLQDDVTEFVPYVFQILSLLLEMHNDGIPEPYMALFPFLVHPILWDRPANIHPLVKLLQSYIGRGPQQIVASEKLSAILGVFQKLIASKLNDHEGFYLIQSVIEHLPEPAISQYLKQVFMVVFQRLQSSKTTKYVKCVVVFFSLFAIKYGASALITLIDSIQDKMFAMVLDRLIITELQKVSGNVEKRICAVGITKILCEAKETLPGQYSNYWAPLLQALIGLFELPEDTTIPEDEHFIEIEDTPGYQSSYSQLVFVGKVEHDPLKGIVADPKIFLAQSLAKVSVANPGKVGPLVNSAIAPEAQNFLQKYLNAANVQLV